VDILYTMATPEVEYTNIFQIVKEVPERFGIRRICLYGCKDPSIHTPETHTATDHVTELSVCRSCGNRFKRHRRLANIWYTDFEGIVLAGMPSCFENFIYHCLKCDGPVHRVYREMDGKTPVDSLSFSIRGVTDIKRYQRTFYECQSCGHGGETEKDHWMG